MLPSIATTPARCQRDEHMTCLVYRWALAPIDADHYPALELVWGESGEMTLAVLEHDPLMKPETP